jgi:hypothetical protein
MLNLHMNQNYKMHNYHQMLPKHHPLIKFEITSKQVLLELHHPHVSSYTHNEQLEILEQGGLIDPYNSFSNFYF